MYKKLSKERELKMEPKRKAIIAILLIGIIFVGVVVWLYYQQETDEKQGNQTVFNITTEKDDATEVPTATMDEVVDNTKVTSDADNESQETTTTAEKKQNKKLPDNYEWDEKRWGEPPQIVYDFAENQEKFDFIVSEIDSLLSGEDGFSTWKENDKIHYDSEYGNQLSSELKKKIDYILNNTKFYDFTKYEAGRWVIEYKQDEDRHMYIYTMRYAPGMTEEEAWDNGYMKVVGDWYFVTIWKV